MNVERSRRAGGSYQAQHEANAREWLRRYSAALANAFAPQASEAVGQPDAILARALDEARMANVDLANL